MITAILPTRLASQLLNNLSHCLEPASEGRFLDARLASGAGVEQLSGQGEGQGQPEGQDQQQLLIQEGVQQPGPSDAYPDFETQGLRRRQSFNHFGDNRLRPGLLPDSTRAAPGRPPGD